MPTPSSSTLTRRAQAAEKAGKKSLAKKLRARAAKLRREDREAKKFQSSTVTELDNGKLGKVVRAGRRNRKATKRNNIIEGRNKIIKGLNQALNQALDADTANDNAAAGVYVQMAPDGPPGKGEIVGGYLASLANELAKLARKKGGIDAIQTQLKLLEASARYDGAAEAEVNFRKERHAVSEKTRDKIVCGFIAEVDAYQQAHRGIPTHHMCTIDGYRLVNIVDALNAAGYTSHGKR